MKKRYLTSLLSQHLSIVQQSFYVAGHKPILLGHQFFSF